MMPQQPELIPPLFATNPAQRPEPAHRLEAAPVSSSQHPHTPQRIPRWLVRAELFLRVVLRMYIGLAVCYAPWSHIFWDRNPLFAQFPTLYHFAANGAVRGIVSGLGLLNLWIALQDALRNRSRE